MDLHSINTTYRCRCKKGVLGERKRMICKSLSAVFLASCIPGRQCVACLCFCSRWIKFFSVVVIHLFEEVKAESKNVLNEYVKRVALRLNILNL